MITERYGSIYSGCISEVTDLIFVFALRRGNSDKRKTQKCLRAGEFASRMKSVPPEHVAADDGLAGRSKAKARNLVLAVALKIAVTLPALLVANDFQRETLTNSSASHCPARQNRDAGHSRRPSERRH